MWAASGYSNQMLDLLPRIRDEGYPTGIINFYGQEGGTFELEGIRQYPKIGDQWGTDAMIHHGKDFSADVVMSLQDLWVLDMNNLKQVKYWIPWVPVDHDPIPSAVFERLQLAYRIISMSKFGHKQLLDRGMHSTYIPHTVDTDIFKPMDRLAIRKELGLKEDVFLFGMVSANKDNPPRKSFQEVMDAFKVFYTEHPNSGIYFHTSLRQTGGFPIEEYAKFIGIDKAIYSAEAYIQMYKVDKNAMAKLLNAFDVLAAPSSSEGFGIPIIEAQACGIPVITNDFTAMPEHVVDGKTGWITKVGYKRYSPLGAYIGIPDTRSIYDCMEKSFKADRTKMAIDCRSHMIENYDLKKVFAERWLPFLKNLEREVLVDNPQISK